jgi:hypothetical protein
MAQNCGEVNAGSLSHLSEKGPSFASFHFVIFHFSLIEGGREYG